MTRPVLAFVASMLCLALSAVAPGTTMALGDPPPYRVSPPRVVKIAGRTLRPAARRVLVISIDGLSFSMFRRHRHRLPNLRRLARRGFWRPLESVFPSVTWAAHVSLITGQYPRHHGVLANRWLEGGALVRPYRDADWDARRRARVPSLFELVAAKGGQVAALNWPATQGARAIHYNMPEVMYDRRLPHAWLSPPLRRLLQTRARRELSRGRRAGYLSDLFGRVAEREAVETDMLVRDIATWLVRPGRPRWLRPEPLRSRTRGGRSVASRGPSAPRLMLVHLLTLDSWMHRYGTNRWVTRWGMEQADAAVGTILRAYRRARLLSSTAVFVLSDHGFVEIERTMNIQAALQAGGLGRYRALLNGHAALLYPNGGAPADGAVASLLRSARHAACVEAVYAPPAYAALGLPRPTGGPASAPSSASAVPDRHRGAPALVALSRPNCIFRNGGPLHGALGARPIGFHGYLPSHPQMKAVLIGHGPGLRRRGRRPGARVVDVAPTIARLMGLRWPSHWPPSSGRRLTLDGIVLTDVVAPSQKPDTTPPARSDLTTPKTTRQRR